MKNYDGKNFKMSPEQSEGNQAGLKNLVTRMKRFENCRAQMRIKQ